MNIQIATPALLFPAISLLYLSYTNRFLALSALIRNLHSQTKEDEGTLNKKIHAQIENLRFRLKLIKTMQVAGAVSLVFCVLSMGVLLADIKLLGAIFFVCALVLMGYSLVALVLETMHSGGALKILLDEAEDRAS